MASPTFSKEQLRAAAFGVLAGKVPEPFGIQFNNFNNLKIGVRARLASLNLIAPQDPTSHPADSALEKEDEFVFRTVFDDLLTLGAIRLVDLDDKYGTSRFETKLLPPPFDLNWQFVEELSGGGQSKTYKVVSKGADGGFGVLKLPTGLSPIARTRFLREVDILRNTKHPAIVNLLDSNLDDTLPAVLGYVTPFGIPLDKYWSTKSLELDPTKTYDLAYAIVRQLCSGLLPLHQQEVVHRDLKPENIVMINDRPVVIDFGVANRPEFEPLSEYEGRPVANRFATPPAAFYGLAPRLPNWDCLGLAWLYGFMIGEGRPKQFHWRFHTMIEEPRAERARAVLAACSHEGTVPSDAGRFLELMDRFRLGGDKNTVSSGVTSGADLADAELASAESMAKKHLQRANERELVEVSMQILDHPLSQLRQTLMSACIGTPNLRVKQYENVGLLPNILPQAKTAPLKGLIYKAYEQFLRNSQVPWVCLFSCRCDAPLKPFHVVALIGFGQKEIEGSLRFRLGLWCFAEGALAPSIARLYSILSDGTFRDWDNKAATGEAIAALARGWIANPVHWAQGLPAPRLERRPLAP